MGVRGVVYCMAVVEGCHMEVLIKDLKPLVTGPDSVLEMLAPRLYVDGSLPSPSSLR
jgi:hypothetical protein